MLLLVFHGGLRRLQNSQLQFRLACTAELFHSDVGSFANTASRPPNRKSNRNRSRTSRTPLPRLGRLVSACSSPCELYPCVFCRLQSPSNCCTVLLNTSTIKVVDK